VPNLFRVGILVFLLVQVPWMSFRWYRCYGKLIYAEPELAEARRWWRESMVIWCLAVSRRFGNSLRSFSELGVATYDR
jgi:hypothetical protein